MPDHKNRQPTERERKTVFAPHESPQRQGDGDPGRKPRPRIEDEDSEAQEEAAEAGKTAGDGVQRDESR